MKYWAELFITDYFVLAHLYIYIQCVLLYLQITTFLIYFIMAYMAAFPFSLMFEAPIMGLDKLLFAPPKRKN